MNLGYGSRLANVSPHVDDLDDRLKSLESREDSSGLCFEDFLGEMGNCNKRGCNEIVSSLTESKIKEMTDKVHHHDKSLVQGLAQAAGSTLNMDEIKLYQIGKPMKNKACPHKIIFRSIPEMTSFLDG